MTATPTPDAGALAACPFASCGSTNVAVIKMDDTDYVCACQSCGATGPAGTKGKQSEKRAFAIAAWNTRSHAPVSGEALEAVTCPVTGEEITRPTFADEGRWNEERNELVRQRDEAIRASLEHFKSSIHFSKEVIALRETNRALLARVNSMEGYLPLSEPGDDYRSGLERERDALKAEVESLRQHCAGAGREGGV